MLPSRLKAVCVTLPTLGLTTKHRKLAVLALAALLVVLLLGIIITRDSPQDADHSFRRAIRDSDSPIKKLQKVRKSKSHSLKTHSRKETHAKRQQQDVKLAVIHDLLETRAKLEMETPAAPETDLPSNHLTTDSSFGNGMATHENFDAEKVYNLFCSCRKQDDVLLLDCYINAYEELCKLFRHFGTVFSFVTSDVEEKIGILRDYRKSEHAEQYKTIQSMLAYEVESDTVKKKKTNSGSRTLLRLHRALEFIIEFLLKLKESDNHCKFSNVVTKAYDDTLAKHHPWLIKKAVHVAMYMLPTRPDLLKKMGLKDEEKDMHVVMDLVRELNLIYKITQDLYAKDNLLELP